MAKKQHDSAHHGVVPLRGGSYDQAAHAGQAEYSLNDHGAPDDAG